MAPRSSALRDALALAAVFGVLLGGLYLYTGIWPPAVIVESGSMMHPDNDVTYGRFGTIDPGDLVLVREVRDVEDVETFVEGGPERYGKSGDVVVYYPADNRARVPIIHRAMAYVERVAEGDDVTYRVRWNPAADCPPGAAKDGRWCVWGSEGITLDMGSSLRLNAYDPIRGGFITKGDNPATNGLPDQMQELSVDAQGNPSPVQLSWLEGKARGELPWLGLIKLALAPRYNQATCGSYPMEFHFFEESRSGACRGWYALGHAYAPVDLWVMLGVALFALVGLPLLYDLWRNQRAKRAAAAAPAEPEGPQRPPPPPP